MSTARLFWRGVADMRRRPLPQLCALVTVCMAAFLAGASLLFLYNVQEEVLRTQGQARFQIYWSSDANMTAVEQQWDELKRLPDAAEVSTFTPREALAELMRTLGAAQSASAQRASTRSASTQNASAQAAGTPAKRAANATRATGGADDFSWLAGENPLPATALVSFDIPPGRSPEPWMGHMYAQLHGLPGVDRVTYDAGQLSLAKGWIELIQGSVLPALGFFALLVALVVGNTVQLMMLSRRDEVEILELVGATPWFIRAPLLANGLVQGFLGGTLSLFGLKLLQVWMKGLLDAPPLFLRVEFLPAWQCFALVFATTFVAGLAALLAARR